MTPTTIPAEKQSDGQCDYDSGHVGLLRFRPVALSADPTADDPGRAEIPDGLVLVDAVPRMSTIWMDYPVGPVEAVLSDSLDSYGRYWRIQADLLLESDPYSVSSRSSQPLVPIVVSTTREAGHKPDRPKNIPASRMAGIIWMDRITDIEVLECRGGRMTTPMYREIADQFASKSSPESSRPAGCRPSTTCKSSTTRPATPSGTRSSNSPLSGSSRPGPARALLSIPKIDPFVTTLTGDPSEGRGGGEGASYASEVERQARKPSVSSVQVEILEASEDVAGGLWVPMGTEVISRHLSVTSTAPPGRWKPRFTRASSPTVGRTGCDEPRTSRWAPSSTSGTRSASSR